MGNKKLLLLVLWVAVLCVGMCRCWVEDVAEDRADEAKQFAASTVQDVKEKTQSLADWARDALSENFGSENDIEQYASEKMKYKAEHAASRATETLKFAASGASEYASQKATDTKEAISGARAYGREKASEAYNGGEYDVIRLPIDKMAEAKDTMQDTYEDAKQKLHIASDKASENFYDAMDTASNVYDEARNKISVMASGNERIKMASQRMYDVKNKVKDAMDCGSDQAFHAYEEAKERMNMAGDNKANNAEDDFDRAKYEVGDAYLRAKNSMSDAAKAKYEAAKEKASEATGNLGAKMRNSPEV